MQDGKPNLFEIVELIYAAGLDPAAWPKITEYLGRTFPFAAVALQVANLGDTNDVNFSLANWEDGALESYAGHFFNISPWVKVHQQARLGVPYHAYETCPSFSFLNTEFYHDWIRPYKVGCGATAIKLIDDGRRFATLSMNYDERLFQRAKDPIAHLFTTLAPHLNRAIEMNRRISCSETLARTVEGLLHAIAGPAFLLTSDCRIVQMNERADQLVKQRSGGISLGRAGHLLLESAADTRKLKRLVAEAANPNRIYPSSANGLLSIQTTGTGPNSIFVFPVVAPSDQSIIRIIQDSSRQVLAVVNYRADAARPQADVLMGALGLSPAEARVVVAFAMGQRLTEYAEQTGRSIHTVRLQLKSAMAKTGCHTQADLMRVVMGTQI